MKHGEIGREQLRKRDHGRLDDAIGERSPNEHDRAPVAVTADHDHYSYGADVRFGEVEVDQARAAGVVVEFERGWPVIVDPSLFRELVKQAIARTVTELEARVAERTAEKDAQRHAAAELPADPGTEARREEQRAIREIAESAHGVNLDLGASLLTGLSTVDPADMAVARFFVLVGSARGAWAARHVLARLAWFPPAATSNRACGSLAHGSPTFFTAGIQRPVRHDLLGRGATMVPPRLISPIRSGD